MINKITTLISFLKELICSKINANVRYKIIEVTNEQTVIWLNCIQTNTIFSKKIVDLTIDLDLISQLLPEQACYCGILLGENLKKRDESGYYPNMAVIKKNFFLYTKAGNNCTDIAFDRFENVIYTHPKTKKICSHNAINIISDRSLINLFHPTVACFIGFHVGYKNTDTNLSSTTKTKGHLRLIINSC